MKLIDSDAVLSSFVPSEHYSGREVMELLRQQPIACDMDKIKKQLSDESDFFSDSYHSGTLQKIYYCKGIERALDILNGNMEK